MNASKQTHTGKYSLSQRGYWSDHWSYLLDLLQSHNSIFPDKEQDLLWGDVDVDDDGSGGVPFYFSPAYIKPRSERYTLVPNPDKPGSSTIRVFTAVTQEGDSDYSPERLQEYKSILKGNGNGSDSTNESDELGYLGDTTGAGSIFQRSLKTKKIYKVAILTKLIMISVLKFSSMDPAGT